MTAAQPQIYGLLALANEERSAPTPVPLTRVSVHGHVVGRCATVKLTQVFENRGAHPIEASYTFPLDTMAVICGFEVEIQGRRIVGEVQEKGKAAETYDDAVAAGHGAYALRQLRPDVFQMAVGCLEPHTSATIQLEYVSLLNEEFVGDAGYALAFVLPTTVAPRYGSSTNPDHHDTDERNPTAQVPYAARDVCPMDLRLTIDGTSVLDVTSPTHHVTVKPPQHNEVLWELEMENQDASVMNRDFVVRIKRVDPSQEPVAVVEPGTDEEEAAAVLLSLRPTHPSSSQIPTAKPTEYIFLVDQSGSMGGSQNDDCKRAMQQYLDRLPKRHALVNIVAFGSDFRCLSRGEALDLSHLDNMRKATTFVRGFSASMGGTDLLQPLNWIFNQPSPKGYTRNVFVLTDGQVSNEHEVIHLIKTNATKATVFAMGIGSSVSRHLCEGIAHAGGGTVDFVGNGESLEAKVLHQLRQSLILVHDLRIDWHGQDIVGQVPAGGSPFTCCLGDEVLVLALVHVQPWWKSSEASSRALATLCGALGEKTPLIVQTTVNTIQAQVDSGKNLHRLAAKYIVEDVSARSLQAHAKEALVSMALQYGIVTQYTSFVAVEERTTVKESGTLELVRVPLVVPQRRRAARGNLGHLAGGDSWFGEAQESTIGADFHVAHSTIGGIDLCSQVWDTAGQERFRSLAPMYYRGATGVMVVYDITQRGTLTQAESFVEEVRMQAPDAAVILLGNKADLEEQRAVSPEEGQALADSLGLPFFEVSAKTCDGLVEAFSELYIDMLNKQSAIGATSHMALKVVSAGVGGVGKTSLNRRFKAFVPDESLLDHVTLGMGGVSPPVAKSAPVESTPGLLERILRALHLKK